MTPHLTTTQDQRICYGLPADWLTGWMAAVGATVVDPQLRLSWTEEEIPVAMFSHQKGHDPVKSLSEVWPSLGRRLDAMPGARDATTNKNDYSEISVKVFADRLAGARNHPDAFSLTSSLTDLHWESSKEGDKAVYGPFETSGPGSTKWLHHRCRKVYSSVGDPTKGMEEMFDGVSQRIADNGLGLDAGRIGAIRDSGETQMVEPVVEGLAYFALALFPVRGAGKQVKASRGRQRGWGVGPYRDWDFIWPAWRQPLDRWGIDALLTAWHNTWRRSKRGKDDWIASRAEWDLLGIHTGWCTSRFKQRTSRDMTRGYGSQQIDAY
ncbi:MAG: hypothetical protein F4X09_13565 [Gammaproteobacteria bacterium]|nr:hypothetical protein [bacterium]MYA38787.1 hypothetical protein [Acidimicrobiia bacterium]MYC61204.1 hypothetical protein [Gammaproteobacteria bacterium]MYB79400.1 hypothetical protein [Acidimicrobiia bacterium]MYH05258.1 hypothetical protein [Acidimicrobiia bacterium]